LYMNDESPSSVQNILKKPWSRPKPCVIFSQAISISYPPVGRDSMKV